MPDASPIHAVGSFDLKSITGSKEKVAASDLFVLIVAWRYGVVPSGQTKSITEQEYDEAVRLRKPIFIFLADPGSEADDGPLALFPAAVRNPAQTPQLAAFRALLADSDRHTFATFTTPDDLASKVVEALASYLLRTAGAQSRTPGAIGRIVALAEMPRHGALVGRADLLPGLLQRLTAGDDIGIFALGGIGGVGKTALAVAAVSDLADDAQTFPGGVIWIPCTDQIGETGLNTLVERIARDLRLEDVLAETDLSARRQTLAAALASRPRTLLALDNVEPGLDAEAALAILIAPGHTTLLLTARDHIAQGHLRTIDVSPLPPDDAEALFARRLAQDTGDARPSEAERAEIAPLVAAVERLPLAIELLAAYAVRQNMSLARLRTDLAAEGINAAAFRTDPNRTLMKTFDRSWRVLALRQQALFAGLSLLAGASFPREAALALALAAAAQTTADTDPAKPDPEADLDALVRARLVEPLEGGRLRLHQMLREYAVHQLADPAVTPAAVAYALRDAALAYWLAYAQAHPSYEGIDALEAEDEGLMGAAVLAHAHQQHTTLLALAHALSMYWEVRARVASERMVYPWALEAARAIHDETEERWALHQNALTDAQAGLIDSAQAQLQEALALARRLGDPRAERAELHGLAVLLAQTGHPAEAQAQYQEALALARRLDDPRALATELRNLGIFIGQRDEPERGRAMIEEALEICTELGAVRETGKCHQFLAWLDRDEDNRAGMIAHYREALRLFTQVHSPVADEVRAALRALGEEV
ncbi:MAG TPA: NB-ARC domain-containing protein [Ktedonobacterales bacterium]